MYSISSKLSQKALSLDIGMNIGYINRLECKKDFLPSVEVLLKIIEACEITAEEFFYGDIMAYEKDKQIIKKIKTSPKIAELLDCDAELLNIFSILNERGKPLEQKDFDLMKKPK